MINILNFAVIDTPELSKIEQLGIITHVGIAAGELKNPDEEKVKMLLKKYDPDILIVNSLPLNQTCIDILTKVKLIVCARGNPLNVDVDYCHKKGIPVTFTPGRNANGVAEFTLAMILNLFRKIPNAILAVRNKECTLDKVPSEINPDAKDIIWMHKDLPYFPYNEFNGREISGTTLGLIGFGYIGQLIANKAYALGMHVIVYDPFINTKLVAKFPVFQVSLEELLIQSDVVSLHAKSTKDTFHMIGNKELQQMKESAILINTARSTLVDVDALIKALKEKIIFGAALDVFDYEPLSSQDKVLLENSNNLIITPHIGGATKEVTLHQSRMIRESLEAFVNNTPIPYQAK